MEAILTAEESYIESLWRKIETKLSRTSDRIRDTMPYTTTDGKYGDCEPTHPYWWTNTFWTGILWHLFRETKDEKYRRFAESVESKLDSVLLDYDELHHDVGFMWLLSSVMNHEQTGSESARKRALLAASVLASRFNHAGGYIRAWNGENKGWAIIDCMMNIPLLYWASEKLGYDRFAQIGRAHADKARKHFVREDGSVNHIVVFDDNGDFLEAPAGQGYASGSSWSRGQSWAIYGFAQSFHWTKRAEDLAAAKSVAHYVLANWGSSGLVPLCDYRQPPESKLLDSSAGAIAACGLIEIAKAVPPAEQGLYLSASIRILKALDENCGLWNASSEALLSAGTSAFHAKAGGPWDVFEGALIYGDFYFVEAVCKLKSLRESS